MPKTAAKPAPIPQITSRRRSSSFRRSMSAKRLVIAAPIWAHGPSFPTDPPNASVTTVARSLIGRDLPGDAAGVPVDRRDHGLGPVAARRRREIADEEDARRKGEREQPTREPARRHAPHPGPRGRERPQERARPESDAEPGRRAQDRPLERADQERRVLRVPARLVREARRGLLFRLQSAGRHDEVRATVLRTTRTRHASSRRGAPSRKRSSSGATRRRRGSRDTHAWRPRGALRAPCCRRRFPARHSGPRSSLGPRVGPEPRRIARERVALRRLDPGTVELEEGVLEIAAAVDLVNGRRQHVLRDTRRRRRRGRSGLEPHDRRRRRRGRSRDLCRRLRRAGCGEKPERRARRGTAT